MDFNSFLCFERIDANQSGFIEIDDFLYFLEEYKMFHKAKEILNLISLYDEDVDCKLSFKEFVCFYLI